jgi:Glycosyltransferase family 87
LRDRAQALPESGPLTVALFAEIPFICVAFYIWRIAVVRGWAMQDFMAVRSAAGDVVHGISPYPPPDPGSIAHATRLVYPPLIAYLFSPFTLLPYQAAAATFILVSLAAVPLALRLLDVRDWRCYGLAFLCYPVLASLPVGAIGPPLTLLVALVWRYRDRPLALAPLLALTMTLKLFLWPLAIWAIATRRWRAVVIAAPLTVAAVLLPFLPLGVHVLRSYPAVLHVLDEVFGPISFSTHTLLVALGAPSGLATALVIALGIGLAGIIVVAARTNDGDRLALSFAVVAALLLSPIVWVHYYVLLLVPIALVHPRLSRVWFLPLAFWGTHALESDGDLWRLLLAALVVVCIALATARSAKWGMWAVTSTRRRCRFRPASGALPPRSLSVWPDLGACRTETCTSVAQRPICTLPIAHDQSSAAGR